MGSDKKKKQSKMSVYTKENQAKKSKEKKKRKDSTEESKKSPICFNMESESCRNKRENKLWASVITVFDLEAPNSIVLMKASETALKLSKEAFKERLELEKMARYVWRIQQNARETFERLSYDAQMAKTKWRHFKATSDKYNMIKYESATENALAQYMKLKEKAIQADRIAAESLSSYKRIFKLAKEKVDIFNQRIAKLGASVARFKERETKRMETVKKNVRDAESALDEAIKQKNAHSLIMKKAKKAAEEATACYVEMEDNAVSAKKEYVQKAWKVNELKDKILVCDKMEKEIDAGKVTYKRNLDLYEDINDKDSELDTD